MKRLLILGVAVAVVIVVAAVAIAASGGGGGGGDASVPAGAGTSMATVSTQEIGDQGAVLVDSEGKALYASDQENAAGMVLCTDACESFWEPLTVSGSPTANSVPGELGTIQRPDGSRQVTLDGKLLYSFVEDEPGEVTGDGFEDAFDGQTLTWHVLHADGSTGSSGGGSTNTGPFGY